MINYWLNNRNVSICLKVQTDVSKYIYILIHIDIHSDKYDITNYELLK